MTEVGSVYGQSLYELAREETLSATIGEELQVLQLSFQQEPEFIQLLSSHHLTKAQRCQILDDAFRGKVHPYVLNFLKILTEKGYMRHFSDCCETYTNQYNLDNGIISVTAVTAVALREGQAEKLKGKLSQLTGKEIHLRNRIDPAILGGVRLDYDGRQLDDTLSHRLGSIRDLLKNTVL